MRARRARKALVVMLDLDLMEALKKLSLDLDLSMNHLIRATLRTELKRLGMLTTKTSGKQA